MNPVENVAYTLTTGDKSQSGAEREKKGFSLARAVGLLFMIAGVVLLVFAVFNLVVTKLIVPFVDPFMTSVGFLMSGGLFVQGKKAGMVFYVLTLLFLIFDPLGSHRIDAHVDWGASLAVHAVLTFTLLIEWGRGNLS